MDIELLTVCDFAEDVGNGKLVIVGVFDRMVVKSIPAVHPLLSVAARIRFFQYESGNHSLKITLQDADDVYLVPPVYGDLVGSAISGNESSAANIIINVEKLKLNKLGKHSVKLEIDGVLVRSVPFFVTQK